MSYLIVKLINGLPVPVDVAAYVERVCELPGVKAWVQGELDEKALGGKADRRKRVTKTSVKGLAEAALNAGALERLTRLKAWRTGVAKEHNLPPFVIFHDATLRAIAQAGDLPVMIYSNRLAYRVDVTTDMLEELADDARFTAVKESSDDIRRSTEIINRLGSRYATHADLVRSLAAGALT